jgi:hypothetical protein
MSNAERDLHEYSLERGWGKAGNTGERGGSVAMRIAVDRVLLALMVAGLVACASGLFAGVARAEGCANQARRAEQPYGLQLPDCRAYEQVSPLEKSQNDAETGPGHSEVSPSGEAVLYFSPQAFNAAVGSPGDTYVNELSRRGSDGWSTQPLTVPLVSAAASGAALPLVLPLGVTDDLNYALVNSCAFAIVGGEFPCNLYLRDNVTGASEQVAAESGLGGSALAAASADDSHVLIESTHKLLSSSVVGVSNLYDWSGGRLTPVGVLSDGSVPAGGAVAGLGEGAIEQVGDEEVAYDSATQDAMSQSGARVFFHDPETGQAYVRENGMSTVELPAGSIAADAQGSEVLSDAGEGLSEYDVDSAQSTVIAPAGSGVSDVLGLSEDGSYVYFSATAALASGATVGQENTYVWHDASGAMTMTFIGTGLTSNGVTPSGQALLAGAHVYEASSGKLNCALCTEGAPLQVNRTCIACEREELAYTGVYFQGYAGTFGYFSPILGVAAPHSISDDGSRVFFESNNALVPGDTNGVMDVYEWERDGTGSCEQANGCIFLLSSGRSPYPSVLVGASASGSDVFIATRQSLVGQDIDSNYDIYDVRVGGGLASQNPTVVVPCGGDACKPLPSPAPVFGSPASAAFSGAGNITTPVAKAKVKSKPGKVKRHKRKTGKGKKKATKRKRSARRSRRGGARKSVKGRK